VRRLRLAYSAPIHVCGTHSFINTIKRPSCVTSFFLPRINCFFIMAQTGSDWSNDPSSPISCFFARYPNFIYDPTKPLEHEFGRLLRTLGPKSSKIKKAKKHYRIALTEQFNFRFGTNANKLDAWQVLCHCVGIEPAPESITQCRKVSLPDMLILLLVTYFLLQKISKVHVNLVDLVDPSRKSQLPHRFPNVTLLSEYSIRHDKIFPKDLAHAGGVLKALLRQLFS
jgi:hypothetical protein